MPMQTVKIAGDVAGKLRKLRLSHNPLFGNEDCHLLEDSEERLLHAVGNATGHVPRAGGNQARRDQLGRQVVPLGGQKPASEALLEPRPLGWRCMRKGLVETSDDILRPCRSGQ